MKFEINIYLNKCYADMSEVLLNAGADVNAADDDGFTVLILAASDSILENYKIDKNILILNKYDLFS